MHLGRVDDAGLEHVLVHASGGVVPNLDVAVLQHLRSGSILAACTSDTQPLQATSHPIRAGMTTVAAVLAAAALRNRQMKPRTVNHKTSCATLLQKAGVMMYLVLQS